MFRKSAGFALVCVVGMLAAAPSFASDPVKDLVDREVPTLKDGSRIPMADVQAAILAACQRRGFAATVDGPGMITARFTHGAHWFDVSIPFSSTAYSILYKDSANMDYNPKKNRIHDSYNEYVEGLTEHIEADFERALKRMKIARR